jgi:hypothetical protein
MKMFQGLGLVVIAMSIGGASIAFAESLAEKKKHKEQVEYLQKELDYTNEKCGTKITASFDWSKSKLEDMDKYSAYGYCESALDALESICEDSDGKEAVQKDVKKVVCKFGAKDKRAISLKGGTLEWTMDWEASNNADYIKEYLMKTL